MKEKMLKRHTGFAIFMHWFNAFCWLFLLLTGFGLIDNQALSPIGTGWSQWMKNLIGGGSLLVAHIAVGIIWSVMFLVFAISHPKNHLILYVKEIFRFSFKQDVNWLVKKMALMTLGEKFLRRKNIDPKLPEQGFYNVGQKMFAIPSLIGGVIISITGLLMTLSLWIEVSAAIVQWSIFIHFLTVGLVFAGLIIHIYMAAIDKNERPAFKSMFSGEVPEAFAKHHNPVWYRQVKNTL